MRSDDQFVGLGRDFARTESYMGWTVEGRTKSLHINWHEKETLLRKNSGWTAGTNS